MRLTDKSSNNIQILRGLAIIAVVFIHNTPGGLMQVCCRPFLNFAVGLFLFLSGMLSKASNWKPQKRILKVLIPYILWTIIYVILYNLRTPTIIPITFLKELLTGRAAGIMYYVFVYCEFTLLIPLIDKLAKSKYRYWGFVITPIEIVFMRMIPWFTNYEVDEGISIIMHISCLGWFTYYYLGYLVGNNYMNIKYKTNSLLLLWLCAMIIQIVEGYILFKIGETDCGTQLKLSSILTGVPVMFMAYKFINFEKSFELKLLKILGDNSFGIYFSHLIIMSILDKIPYYKRCVIYPVNAVIAVAVSAICVVIGKKILGRYARYLAL